MYFIFYLKIEKKHGERFCIFFLNIKQGQEQYENA